MARNTHRLVVCWVSAISYATSVYDFVRIVTVVAPVFGRAPTCGARQSFGPPPGSSNTIMGGSVAHRVAPPSRIFLPSTWLWHVVHASTFLQVAMVVRAQAGVPSPLLAQGHPAIRSLSVPDFGLAHASRAAKSGVVCATKLPPPDRKRASFYPTSCHGLSIPYILLLLQGRHSPLEGTLLSPKLSPGNGVTIFAAGANVAPHIRAAVRSRDDPVRAHRVHRQQLETPVAAAHRYPSPQRCFDQRAVDPDDGVHVCPEVGYQPLPPAASVSAVAPQVRV